jgi:glyoxylase-like metal-dependent hydrolase (beta-lactamase superfamily II)
VSKFKKKYVVSGRIHLLILSHLHDDHISGLNDLLKRPQISIDLVVLPYIAPIERLIVALTKISLPKWFYDFWADPVQFLIENGVKRVMLLGGSEPTIPKNDFTPERRMEKRALPTL